MGWKFHGEHTRWRGRAQLGFDCDGSEQKLRALTGVSLRSMKGKRGKEFRALGRFRALGATASGFSLSTFPLTSTYKTIELKKKTRTIVE